jgi:hypothetical protein
MEPMDRERMDPEGVGRDGAARDGIGRDRFGRGDAGAIDWDAAFAAIVASLQPTRPQRALRATGQTIVAVALLAVSWWVLALIIAAQMEGLSRPWR